MYALLLYRAHLCRHRDRVVWFAAVSVNLLTKWDLFLAGELLDHVYDLAVLDLQNVKVAKKLLKDLIKMIVKLGLLYRHNQFNEAELAMGQKLSSKFKMIVLTMISYHDVAFSFDAQFLSDLIGQCEVGRTAEEQ